VTVPDDIDGTEVKTNLFDSLLCLRDDVIWCSDIVSLEDEAVREVPDTEVDVLRVDRIAFMVCLTEGFLLDQNDLTEGDVYPELILLLLVDDPKVGLDEI